MKVSEHINKAKHNERCLNELSLADSQFLDWAVTVISYAALHYVDAFLANNFGVHPKDHRERTDVLTRRSVLNRNIRYDFEDLKNDGIEARYSSRIFTTEEVKREILPLLENIKIYIYRHL